MILPAQEFSQISLLRFSPDYEGSENVYLFYKIIILFSNLT